MGARPLSWRLRRGFWNRIAVTKYPANKPARIPAPTDTTRLTPIALSAAWPELPIDNIRIADKVPQACAEPELGDLAVASPYAIYRRTQYGACNRGCRRRTSMPDEQQ